MEHSLYNDDVTTDCTVPAHGGAGVVQDAESSSSPSNCIWSSDAVSAGGPGRGAGPSTSLEPVAAADGPTFRYFLLPHLESKLAKLSPRARKTYLEDLRSTNDSGRVAVFAENTAGHLLAEKKQTGR